MTYPGTQNKTIQKPVFLLPPDVQGRIPPHSRELEEAVLGAMMLERDKVELAIDLLNERSFYIPENQYIFRAIKALYDKGGEIDLLTINQLLRELGELDYVGGSYYLAQLTNRVASAANIEYHARILQQKYLQRELIRISGEMATEAYIDDNDSLVLVEKNIDTLDGLMSGVLTSDDKLDYLHDTASEFIKQFDDDITSKREITGLRSGFPELDQRTLGFQPGDVIVIAARPAMGKSAVGIELIKRMSLEQGYYGLIFNLEMSDKQVKNRLLYNFTNQNRDDLWHMTPEQRNSYYNAFLGSQLNKVCFSHTSNQTMGKIRLKAKRMRREGKLDYILIDYMQLIKQTGKHKDRYTFITELSIELKNLAKTLNVPLIEIAQLSRDGKDKPRLEHLKESGQIEQDAAVVILLDRSEVRNEPLKVISSIGESIEVNSTGLMEFIIAKNRHGRIGSLYYEVDLSKYKIQRNITF